jgi:hypothetical protein
MAGLGLAISRRLYPVPFENGRLAALLVAAALAYGCSLLAPADRALGLLVKLGLLAAFVVVAGVALRRRERPPEL